MKLDYLKIVIAQLAIGGERELKARTELAVSHNREHPEKVLALVGGEHGFTDLVTRDAEQLADFVTWSETNTTWINFDVREFAANMGELLASQICDGMPATLIDTVYDYLCANGEHVMTGWRLFPKFYSVTPACIRPEQVSLLIEWATSRRNQLVAEDLQEDLTDEEYTELAALRKATTRE
jgi:hypothetical protein